MKRNWIKYTIGVVVVCVALWIIAIGIAFFYITSHKEKIKTLIRSEINKRLAGTVSFDDLSTDFFQNFPGISVDLKNVHIRDSLFSVHKRELLSIKDLFVGFGIIDLLTGKKRPKYVTLSGGKIDLFTDSTGYKNWDVLKKESESKPQSSDQAGLRRVTFKNIDAVFEDVGKFKFFEILFENTKCKIHPGKDEIRFGMDNNSLVKSAAFSTKRGSYFTNKKFIADWDIVYDKQSQKLSLKNQVVRFDRQSYRVTGDFFISNDPHFELSFETRNLSLKEAASIFPEKTANKINRFTLSKPIPRLQAFLFGPMKYLSFPTAKIDFYVNDATLGISTVQFDHCSFNVVIRNVNDPSKTPTDENSVLQFTAVKGEWEKNQFDGKNIFIYNLIHPYLKCDIHLLFKLPQLDKAIASPRLDLNSGDGEANLSYEGPLAKTDTGYNINGDVWVRNGDMTYTPRNLRFKNTDIELLFQNGDMVVKKMNTEINDNKISINGRVRGIVNFFNTDSSKANFEWNIYSPRLDIDKLTSALHRSTSTKKKDGYSFFNRFNNKINRLFDDCNALLNIQADKLVYKNFQPTNVKGGLSLKNDLIALNDFSLKDAGGLITVNASAKDNGKNSDITVQSKMQNVNVRELFAAFNNFGLESLRAKNINGTLSADINLTSMLDADNNLYKPANKGYVHFSLENGRLENFQPLMDIDNNFLQKRGLSNISFANLRDSFDIDGNEIKINRMEIKSTAINMYVEGVYSFANNTDLSIQIPLLKQNKDSTVVPEKKGNNSKGGISVFLRAKDDKDGKLKIGYDLLGRFRKKK